MQSRRKVEEKKNVMDKIIINRNGYLVSEVLVLVFGEIMQAKSPKIIPAVSWKKK